MIFKICFFFAVEQLSTSFIRTMMMNHGFQFITIEKLKQKKTSREPWLQNEAKQSTVGSLTKLMELTQCEEMTLVKCSLLSFPCEANAFTLYDPGRRCLRILLVHDHAKLRIR